MRISRLSAAVAAVVLFSPFAMAQVRIDGALACDSGLPSEICEKNRNVEAGYAIDEPINDIARVEPVAPSYGNGEQTAHSLPHEILPPPRGWNIIRIASLSGQAGEVRRRMQFRGSGCRKGWNAYVAASGHSAYATTTQELGGSFGTVCAWALDEGSKAKAEAQALRNCEAGRKRYRRSNIGPCKIIASK